MRIKLFLIIVLGLVVGASTAVLISGYEIQLPYASNSPVSGIARIGGPFQLVNHKGETVTDADFRGRYMLIVFGYTYCPDVCPAELQVMSTVLDELGEKSNAITPVFITVDPKRDNVELMAGYVTHFHQKLIGLTGSEENIRATAKSYGVYYAKSKGSGSSSDYLMDHSSNVYLMDKKGKYVTHFSYGTPTDKIVDRLEKIL